MSDLGPVAFASPWYSSEIETIDLSGIEDPAVRAALVKIKLAAQEQSRLLMGWHQMLQYGPVPGSYFPIYFSWTQPTAGPFLATGSPWQRIRVPCSFIPIAVTTSRSGGTSFEFDLDDGNGDSIFPTTTTTGATYNAAGDFTNGRRSVVATPVILNITAVTGNIYRANVTLWCKNASRIEP